MKYYIIPVIFLLKFNNSFCQGKFVSDIPSDTIFEYCHGLCSIDYQMEEIKKDIPPPPPPLNKCNLINSNPIKIKNGIKKWFYDCDNHKVLARIGVFLNGQSNGVWKEFYESGELKYMSFYKIGFRHKQYGFYKNGDTALTENYNNDHLEEGEWKENYENGDPKTRSYYKNGKRVGKWKDYYENGNLRSIQIFINNKAEGEWIKFWENGKIFRMGNYENNELNGEISFFDNDGNLTQKQVFENGEYITSIFY